MIFVADKLALGHVFPRDLLFSPVSIILTVLHARTHLHVALTRRADGLSLGTFQNAVFFGNWVAFCRQALSHSLKMYVTDRLGVLCYTCI